jgi:uncharacterized protein
VTNPVNRGDSARANNAAPGQFATRPPLSPSEDKQWAFLAHCGGILGFIPSLLVYIFMRDRGPFTAQESREALNFTLPPTVVAAFAYLLAFIFALFSPGLGTIFALVGVVIWVFLTVFSVIAALQVNKGQPYRYAVNLRLIH